MTLIVVYILSGAALGAAATMYGNRLLQRYRGAKVAPTGGGGPPPVK